MDLFFAVDFFRNTNVNWPWWPRSGRSCVHVWTIFQGDSTTLQTDQSFTPDLTFLLLKHHNMSLRYLISDNAVLLLILCESVCLLSVWWLVVFNRLITHLAFFFSNGKCLFFLVISLRGMLSVPCKFRFMIIRHRPLVLWPLARLTFTALK